MTWKAAMSGLREVQTAMTAYLTAPPGPDLPRAFASLLAEGSDHPAKRVAVYKNNVYTRFIDALRDTFPAVVRLVGDEFFNYAAAEYVAATPPTSTSLLAYGHAFPEFLSGFSASTSILYLADVARLEYLYLEAYHAADEATGGRGAAGSAAPILHPSARLMSSSYQVSRIWELNRGDGDFSNVTLPQQREFLLIVRPAREVQVRRVRLGEYALLLALDDGAPLAESRREAEQADPSFDFGAYCSVLVTAGILVRAEERKD